MANTAQGDDNRPKCSQCSRTGQQCCRTKGLRKFRDGSSAQYEKQFSKDQVWIGFSKNGRSPLAATYAARSAMIVLSHAAPVFVSHTQPISYQTVAAFSYTKTQLHAIITRFVSNHYVANCESLLAKIQIVDQTAELENFYSVDEPEPEPTPTSDLPNSASRPPGSIDSSARFSHPPRLETTSHSPTQQSTARFETTRKSPTQVSPVSFENILSISGTKRRRRTNDSATSSERFRHIQLPPISQELQNNLSLRDSPSNLSYHSSSYYNNYVSPTEANETRRIEAEYAKLADSEAAKIPDEPLLSFSSWKKNFRWPNQYTTQQCVCLFRYYVDVLGPWVRSYPVIATKVLTGAV